jgi:hypothetical protein
MPQRKKKTRADESEKQPFSRRGDDYSESGVQQRPENAFRFQVNVPGAVSLQTMTNPLFPKFISLQLWMFIA